jgi:hypothetical protein
VEDANFVVGFLFFSRATSSVVRVGCIPVLGGGVGKVWR